MNADNALGKSQPPTSQVLLGKENAVQQGVGIVAGAASRASAARSTLPGLHAREAGS